MRGVVSCEIDRACDEATVVRRRGTASGAVLVEAVKRAGYEARVIPTLRLALDVPGMGCNGCPERVQEALARRRGVRGLLFPTRTKVVVFYDGRRLTHTELMATIRATGFEPRGAR